MPDPQPAIDPLVHVPHATLALAEAAARRVVDTGADYAEAKRQAARELGDRGARQADWPSHEQVEDAVRSHLALFHADTQPAELRALRELALGWMQRLQAHHPHLAGAVWRGTATRLSPVRLELYGDDPKATEIAVLNLGLDTDLAEAPGRRGEPMLVFRAAVPCPALGETVTLLLHVLDLDDLRGALKPDARGRSWRGDLAGLRRLLAHDEGAAP